MSDDENVWKRNFASFCLKLFFYSKISFRFVSFRFAPTKVVSNTPNNICSWVTHETKFKLDIF